MGKPNFLDDPAFKCLRVADLDGYHRAIEGRKTVDFSGADLRGVDFRGADVSRLVLRDAYLRDADLRGCDLRGVDLAGVSIHSAKISGTYFPYEIDAAEIQLSLKQGTRIRMRKNKG
jgi:uncharacterized protein YjbI with pentapeptide repeats